MLTLASICALAADLWADPTTIIRIRERVEIDGAEILLGQIAAIEGGDVRNVQHLKDIVIGKAPSPGNSRQFDRQHIQMRLKKYHIDLTTVVVEAPPHVEVTRSHVEIQKPEIEKIVSEFIVQQTHLKNRTVRIKEIRVPERVILSKGRITYKVKAPRSRQLMGRCPIAVHFSVNGHTQKKVWATAVIEILGPVVVTRKPLGRHKPITEDDIEIQKMDLARLPSDVITDPGEILGQRTRRAIGSKTVLRPNLVEFPPLLKRGDVVVIIAETAGLKITALGQVKKKGRLGERIPVVNFDSKKVLYARVLDGNTVKVDLN